MELKGVRSAVHNVERGGCRSYMNGDAVWAAVLHVDFHIVI